MKITLEARQWTQIPKLVEMPVETAKRIEEAAVSADNWPDLITLDFNQNLGERLQIIARAVEAAGEWTIGYEELWPEIFPEESEEN
jgi:hypothetical protein